MALTRVHAVLVLETPGIDDLVEGLEHVRLVSAGYDAEERMPMCYAASAVRIIRARSALT